jgi:hypothetical protein
MSKLAALTLFHGGTADGVLRKTADATAQAAAALSKGEQVLYVNTLTSEERAEHEIRKACRRHGGAETRRKILLLSVPADEIMAHEDFLEMIVESRNVRLVVITSFDFAAMFGRRRTRLVCLLLRLRDFQQVDIAVGLRHEPGSASHGAIGHLVYQAQRTVRLEDLHRFDATPAEGDEASTATEAEAAATEDEVAASEEGRIALWEAPSMRAFMPSRGPLHGRSLKTNELAPLRPLTLDEYLSQSATES